MVVELINEVRGGNNPNLPPGVSIFELPLKGTETDEDWRPIFENRAQPVVKELAAAHGADFETRLYRYGDSPSRDDASNPMDIAAMRHVARNMSLALQGFVFIRDQVVEPSRRHDLTNKDLYEISRMAFALPIYLFNRGAQPLPTQGALPGYVSAMWKSAMGLGVGFKAVVELAELPDERVDPDKFYHFVEATSLLVSKKGGVCPARPSYIQGVLQHIIDDEVSDETNLRMQNLIPDFGGYYGFVQSSNKLDPVLNRFLKHLGSTGDVAKEYLDILQLDQAGQAEEFLREKLVIATQTETEFAAEFDGIERSVNQGLGRNPYKQPVTIARLAEVFRSTPSLDIKRQLDFLL